MDTTTILTFPEWRALRALVCMFFIILGIHGCGLESGENTTYPTDGGVGGGVGGIGGGGLHRAESPANSRFTPDGLDDAPL